jgi:predicted aldo/keto reductase-like oxidoreductase
MGSWSFDELQSYYAELKTKASDCTECGVCLERCPFDVDVIAKMREAAEIFEKRQ